MVLRKKIAASLLLVAAALLAPGARSQTTQASGTKPAPPPRKAEAVSRITIEVTGGDKGVPVENASVYLKYVEEHIVKRDKKTELNVKTNHEGIAHLPDAPQGRALIQIIAEGWKPHGRWYDITETKQTIKIRLERPPKWY
jgi:hypothetical protein